MTGADFELVDLYQRLLTASSTSEYVGEPHA
jgi:hypothetical protein